MHVLTKEQQIENIELLLNQKQRKVSNLQTEIANLERKLDRVRNSNRNNNQSKRTETQPVSTSSIFD